MFRYCASLLGSSSADARLVAMAVPGDELVLLMPIALALPRAMPPRLAAKATGAGFKAVLWGSAGVKGEAKGVGAVCGAVAAVGCGTGERGAGGGGVCGTG